MTVARLTLPPHFSALVGRQNCIFLAVARVRQLARVLGPVRSVLVEYRESRRAEDQEAGPVGTPGQWPVRLAGGGAAAGEISALIYPGIEKRQK